jgi:hypothetical protein
MGCPLEMCAGQAGTGKAEEKGELQKTGAPALAETPAPREKM